MSPEKEEPMMIPAFTWCVSTATRHVGYLADALLFERLTARRSGAGSVHGDRRPRCPRHPRQAQATSSRSTYLAERCANARLNGILNGTSIDSRRGDLTEAVHGELFDLVISNPPYVPALADDLPTAGIERAWDAGKDGRALIDRIAGTPFTRCSSRAAHCFSCNRYCVGSTRPRRYSKNTVWP